MSSESKSTVVYQNLDTSFINLWGLLRKLSQDGFIGRVRVELKDYTADVFMTGSSTPLVREIDHAAGTETLEEAALHRLVLRARESPGKVSVFEGAHEAQASANHSEAASGMSDQTDSLEAEEPPVISSEIPQLLMNEPTIAESQLAPPIDVASDYLAQAKSLSALHGASDIELNAMVKVSGQLISAVERAANEAAANFASLLRFTRVELADDYPFLDPTSNEFHYANGAVSLRNELSADTYVSGLSELLRRIVNKVAEGDRARRVRERVALELVLVARKESDDLDRSGFYNELDRIAGTKVI